jgi:type IV pilus assembly protein PilF
LCEARSGDRVKAERSLTRSYEMDASQSYNRIQPGLDPLYGRGELTRAQFYVQSIQQQRAGQLGDRCGWGSRIERKLNNPEAMRQLGDQLKRRFPQIKRSRTL